MLQIPPYGSGARPAARINPAREAPGGAPRGESAPARGKDPGENPLRLPEPPASGKPLPEDGRRAAIEGKLQAGGELTERELEYLKRADPDLYQKVLRIKAERRQYRRDLERCKTREEVEALAARKQQIFLSELKAVKRGPETTPEKEKELLADLGRRMAGIRREHAAFQESAACKALPRARQSPTVGRSAGFTGKA